MHFSFGCFDKNESRSVRFTIILHYKIKVFFLTCKLALVGIIPNQLFSFSSDKDSRTDSRIRRKNTAQPAGNRTPGLAGFGRCVLVDSGNPGHLVVEKERTAW